MITFDEFIKKWINKECDYDGYFGTQCMDLMHFYKDEVLNVKEKYLVAPTAKQAWQGSTDTPYWKKIKNTPINVPHKGDIMFWSNGQFGHVAIFLEGNVFKFKSFDANWPVGSLPHVEEHSYWGVAGWLRPNMYTKYDNVATGIVTTEDGLFMRSAPGRSSKRMGVLRKGTRIEIIGECEGESLENNSKWYMLRNEVYIWSGGAEIEKVGDSVTLNEFEVKKAEYEAKKVELEQRRAELEVQAQNVADAKAGLDSEIAAFTAEYEAFLSTPVEQEVVVDPLAQEVQPEVAQPEVVAEKKVGFEYRDDMPSDVKDAVRLINSLIEKYGDYLK